jgi:hypothetical protein
MPRQLGEEAFHEQEKGELQELTQLSGHDMKFDAIDFHAEFIAQPVCFPAGVISSMAELRTTTTDWSDAVVATSFSHLPSFTDTYTPSVVTTIEPRAFGAEAEYMSRLKERRTSSSDDRTTEVLGQRSSVIVRPGLQPGSRDCTPPPASPHPALSALLPVQYDFMCGESGDSDGSHLTLKTEPGGSPYYQAASPGPYPAPSPLSQGEPSFLHFTPDETVSPLHTPPHPLHHPLKAEQMQPK